MSGIKCIHFSKVCETTHGMTKYLLTCKSTMQHTIPCQTQHRANDFLVIPKAETIVSLTKQILGQIQVTYSDKKERLANKVGRINAVGGDDAEIANKVIYESMRSTTSRSRLGIQSTQSGFKLIRFNDGKRG